MADETTVEASAKALTTRYAETKLDMGYTVNRRDALREKAKTLDGLTNDEELELLRVERRAENLKPILENLQRQVYLRDAEIDLDAILKDWHGLVEEKRKAYTNFYNAVARLKNAHGVLLGVHRLQEQVVQRLPGEVVQRLDFPDVGRFETNLIARLPNSLGWRGVFGPPVPCQLPNPTEVQDPDPGTRDLNPRLIARLQSDYGLWKQGQRTS